MNEHNSGCKAGDDTANWSCVPTRHALAIIEREHIHHPKFWRRFFTAMVHKRP